MYMHVSICLSRIIDLEMHYNALQYPATCCNTLHHHATNLNTPGGQNWPGLVLITTLLILQHTATHCNKLQHTAIHYNSLQLPVTHFNTLQHTRRLRLILTGSYRNINRRKSSSNFWCVAACCSVLQCAAVWAEREAAATPSVLQCVAV